MWLGMPEAEKASAPQVVIAFDFGLRRIGCAVGDTLTRRARPLRTLQRAHARELLDSEWQAITDLVHGVGARQIIIGQPYNADGSRHALSDLVEAFSTQIKQRLPLPVHGIDERYSSLEAEQELRQLHERGQRRGTIKKTDIDSMAAALILERWLATLPS